MVCIYFQVTQSLSLLTLHLQQLFLPSLLTSAFTLRVLLSSYFILLSLYILPVYPCRAHFLLMDESVALHTSYFPLV